MARIGCEVNNSVSVLNRACASGHWRRNGHCNPAQCAVQQGKTGEFEA